jgi:hypothetical protein
MGDLLLRSILQHDQYYLAMTRAEILADDVLAAAFSVPDSPIWPMDYIRHYILRHV